MTDRLGNIVGSLLDGIRGISKSETIVGEAQQAGDATIVPIHRLKLAFGAAAGKGGAHSSRIGGDTGLHGAAGGVELDPIAAIAIAKDGTAHVLTVDSDPASTWAGLLEEVPELVARLAHGVGGKMVQAIEQRVDQRLGAGAAAPASAPALEGEKEE